VEGILTEDMQMLPEQKDRPVPDLALNLAGERRETTAGPMELEGKSSRERIGAAERWRKEERVGAGRKQVGLAGKETTPDWEGRDNLY
jgi:hypothetical protein